MKNLKKTAALLLCMAMLFSFLPIIPASAEDSSIAIEYWITNSPVVPNSGAYISETDTSGNYTRIYSEISSAYSGINTSSGVALTDIISSTGASSVSTAEVMLWKGTLLDSENRQTIESDDDEMYDGKDFSRIRCYNGVWSCYTASGYWADVADGDSLVAYYLQKTDLADDVTVAVADWGLAYSEWGEGDINRWFWEWSVEKESDYVIMDCAVVYEDGTQSPAAFPQQNTWFFHFAQNPRIIRAISFYEHTGYEIWKVTVTEGESSGYTSYSTFEAEYDDATETVVWDKSMGGTPFIEKLEYTENFSGRLIRIYVRSKKVLSSGITYSVVNNKAVITGYEGSSTTLTIPSKIGGYPVYSIDAEAFKYCFDLTSVTIEDGIEHIGYKAFAYCWNLKSLRIPKTVSTIDEDAFYYCNKLTLYGKASSAAEDYAAENNIRFAPDMFMKSESKSDISAVSYGTMRTISSAVIISDSDSIWASAAGYYPLELQNHTLDTPRKIALVPRTTYSYISAVHCNGKDILAKDISFLDTYTGVISIRVYSAEISAKKYQLITDGYTVVAESTSGVFNLYTSDLPIGKELYVRVVDYADKKHRRIKIGLNTEYDININFELDELLNVTVPEDVPLIGGKSLEINLENLPVNYRKEDNVLQVVYGESQTFIGDDWEFADLKKAVDNFKKNKKKFSENEKCLTEGGKWGLELKAAGYAEVIFNDYGVPCGINGKIVICLEGSYTQEWQTFCVVPVVLKFKGSSNVQGDFYFGLDTNNNLYLNGTSELVIPKVTGSVGAGVAHIADVSFYGSVANKFYIDVGNYTSASLSGELGISVKVLFLSGKLVLLDGTWDYYNSLSAVQAQSYALERMSMAAIAEELKDEQSYSIDRSYLESTTDWLSVPNIMPLSLDSSSFEVSSTRTLQGSVYNGADPVTVSLQDGSAFMVWTADEPSRTDGNHTAAVWSYYDPGTDSWSEPQIIEDDGTADFHPTLATNGTELYAAWTDTSTEFSADVTMTEVAQACEISVAKFDFESGSFTDITAVTSDSDCDMLPQISFNGEEVFVAWQSNSDNDILSLSGTNAVEYTALSEIDIKTQISTALPILSFDIGVIGGKTAVACVTDTDGDTSTLSDTKLSLGALGEENTDITDGTTEQGTPVFGIVGETDALLWYNGGSISKLTEVSGAAETVIESTSAQKFNLINGAGNSAIVYSDSDDNGSDIYAYIYNGEEWSEAVQITENEGYSDKAGGYIAADERLHITFVRKDVTVTKTDSQEEVSETVDLCDAAVIPHYDISASDISCDIEGILPGESAPVTVTVKNNGLYEVTAVDIGITDAEGNAVYTETRDVSIAVGETIALEISLTLPELTAVTDYTVSVTPSDNTDADLTDNTAVLSIGYSDISVSVERLVSGSAVAAGIKAANSGHRSESITLYLRENDSEGALLGVYDLGIVEAGQTAEYKFDAQLLRQLDTDSDILCFVLECGGTEESYADNEGFLSYFCDTAADLFGNTVGYWYDVNGDGSFDIRDIVRLKKIMASDMAAEECDGYDINGDLVLDILDVTYQKKMILGLSV